MDEALLRKAVRKSLTLRIKYYPNKTGESLKGWRVIQPLGMYRHKGESYYFAYFVQGSSVDGLSGYRVYLVKNINEAEEFTDNIAAYAYNLNAVFEPKERIEHNPERTFNLMIGRNEIE